MICNETTDGGWEIIFQRAHAFLAAELLGPLRPGLRPAPWGALLHATAQHDHGWQEWEPGGRLAEDGAPQHFTDASLEDVASQSRPLLRRLWHQDRWVALLVARHLHYLYQARRGESPALDAFLDEETAWRRDWRAALGVSKEAETRAYAPLRWADAFSLAVCCRQLEGDATGEEDAGPIAALGPGPAGRDESTAARIGPADEEAPDGEVLTVTVEPWPYRTERFTAAFDVRYLERRTFERHDALIEALAAAEPVRREMRMQAPAQ